MKVIVGSTSKRKIDVVKKVFDQYFSDENLEIISHDSVSGVPNTPYDEQTYIGAKNRASDARQAQSANYYVGLETGMVTRYGILFDEAWACVISKDGNEYFGYSSGLRVPNFILKRMKELTMEHSDAMTIIEKELGDLPNDNSSTYTGGILLRAMSLEEALRNALVQTLPHKTNLYSKK